MQLTKNIKFHNQFRLIELKGRGSYGEVWLAHDEQHNMEVAIKIFNIALDSHEIEVFKSEYSLALELDHPNLLRTYHLGFFDNNPYLVMPYCPDSAAILIGKVNEPTLWRFIYDVASGLAYLHENGIVHNNIKPDNVLINQQDHFVITDYGISPRLRDTLEHNLERKGAAGTPAYKAPELFESPSSAVYATDVWALGALLYEMASGELPFYGMGGVVLCRGEKISRPKWPYSENLIDTILQCLAKETWDRPWAKDLAKRAQNALAGYSHIGNSVESPKEETPIHDNNHVEDPSAYEILHDPQQNDPQKRDTSTKKKTVKVLGLVLVALLLGAVGFLGWKLTQVTSAKTNDNLMFQNCETSNDYRVYMKKYPDGVNFELAKSRLEEWVRDSVNQADTLKLVEPEQINTLPETSAIKTDNKNQEIKEETEKERTNHQEMDKQKNYGNNDSRNVPSINQQASASLNTQGNANLTPSPIKSEPNLHSGLTKASDVPAPKTEGLKQTSSDSPSSEEESYQRTLSHNATLEDCLYWMDKYGDVKTRDKTKWSKVKSVFLQLYSKKIQDCKTIQDFEKFLNEHDGIMKKARLSGSDTDRKMRRDAEHRKKSLEKQS